MLFNSIQFFVFFVFVYGLYCFLSHRWQNLLLLLASYYFYGSWDWRFLGLIWISTFLDYVCGLKIAHAGQPSGRRLWLAIGVCGNLGILGFFKYFNFFADSFQRLASVIGWSVDLVTLDIVLPVGISFYTFQTMSYTIDIYRGEMKPTRNLLDFSLFVAFFPQLVAGPIERAKTLLPQIACPRHTTREQFVEGSYLIVWGLFKKVFIADNLAGIVDTTFARTGIFSGAEALIGLYAFAFQIYGDFAGYSDMARGLGKLMGVELMINFRRPYLVTNPAEFWRHWHISLSTWLRDYLYISLGGNRNGAVKTYRNLLLTMLLGGLWHGAAWKFVLWGAYQGIALVICRAAQPFLQKHALPTDHPMKPLWVTVKVILMFHLTCFGWLIFRAHTIGQAGEILGNILWHFALPGMGGNNLRSLGYYLVFLVLLSGGWRLRRLFPAMALARYPLSGALLGCIVYLLAFHAAPTRAFIYFQF